MVVVSDALAAKLGSAPSAEPTTTSARDAAAAAAAAPAPAPTGGAGAAGAGSSGLPAAGAAAGEDAELEALLRQLDINPQPTSSSSGGGGWGPAAAPSTARPPSSLAAAGARGQEADMEAHALLETLGLGLGAAAPPAAQQGSAAAAAAAAAEPGDAPGPLPPGVHVLSTAQYFARYYGANPAVWDLYESQAQSLAEEAQGGAASAGSGYAPHLSTAAVDAGLSQGTLLQVGTWRWAAAGCPLLPALRMLPLVVLVAGRALGPTYDVPREAGGETPCRRTCPAVLTLLYPLRFVARRAGRAEHEPAGDARGHRAGRWGPGGRSAPRADLRQGRPQQSGAGRHSGRWVGAGGGFGWVGGWVSRLVGGKGGRGSRQGATALCIAPAVTFCGQAAPPP